MYNSLTLKAPLQMAFKELTEELENLISKGNLQRLPAVGYKLMELGFTLDSTRINDNSGIDYIINKSELLRDPNLNMLANHFSLVRMIGIYHLFAFIRININSAIGMSISNAIG